MSLDAVRESLREAGIAQIPALASEVASLKATGCLSASRVGGKLLYAPREFVATCAPPANEAALALLALERACEQARRMVSTHEVGKAAQALGLEFGADAGRSKHSNECVLRHRLNTLARPRTTERRGEVNRPSVRLDVVVGTDGRPHSYWAPASRAELNLPSDAASSSAPEAVRTALRTATAAAGRPLSRSELGLHLLQLPLSHPARQLLTSDAGRVNIAPALASAMRTPGRDKEASSVLRAVTPWTAHGGAPERFWFGDAHVPLNIVAADALTLDDITVGWRLAQEAVSISTLEARLSPVDRHLLAPIIDARRAALHAAIGFGRRCIVGDLAAAMQLSERADDEIVSWARSTVGRVQGRSLDVSEIAQRRRHRHDLVALFRGDKGAGRDGTYAGRKSSSVPARPSRLPASVRLPRSPSWYHGLVGNVGHTSVAELASYATGLVDTDARPGMLANALSGCRRFKNHVAYSQTRFKCRLQSDSNAFAQEGPDPLSRLDRAEALLELGHLVPDAWTRLMFTRGYSVLGEMSRATDPICEALRMVTEDTARNGSAAVRRWVVVAAAMAGIPDVVPLALQLAQSPAAAVDRTQNLRTALLSLGLADPDQLPVNIDLLHTGIASLSIIASERILRRATVRAKRGFALSVAA